MLLIVCRAVQCVPETTLLMVYLRFLFVQNKGTSLMSVSARYLYERQYFHGLTFFIISSVVVVGDIARADLHLSLTSLQSCDQVLAQLRS